MAEEGSRSGRNLDGGGFDVCIPIQEKVGFLLKLFVVAYNFEPESWVTTVSIAVRCSKHAWSFGLPFSMSPKYVFERGAFERGTLSCTLKYGVVKALPQERYLKPTKRQLQDLSMEYTVTLNCGIFEFVNV